MTVARLGTQIPNFRLVHLLRRGVRSPLFIEIARQTLGALDLLSSKGVRKKSSADVIAIAV